MIRLRFALPAAAAILLGAAPDARAGNLVIRLPVPDVGLGIAVGQTRIQDTDEEGNTRAVSLRLRFGNHVELTGELGKATYGDRGRTDLHYGGGAYLNLGGRHRVSPYAGLVAGTGTIDSGWFTADQFWAHVAVGLAVPLSRRVALAAEVNVGRRKLRFTGESVLLDANDLALIYIPDEEDYRQAQVGLTLSF